MLHLWWSDKLFIGIIILRNEEIEWRVPVFLVVQKKHCRSPLKSQLSFFSFFVWIFQCFYNLFCSCFTSELLSDPDISQPNHAYASLSISSFSLSQNKTIKTEVKIIANKTNKIENTMTRWNKTKIKIESVEFCGMYFGIYIYTHTHVWLISMY